MQFLHINAALLTLNGPIVTKLVCFSRLLKCLRSLYDKQCGPRSAWADPEGGTGGPDLLENHKNIGFLSNTGPDPRKWQSYQASIQCRVIIGTPAKRHLNGVSLAGQWWPAYSVIWILSKKRLLQSWTPSGKTFCIRAWSDCSYRSSLFWVHAVCCYT